MGDQRIAVAALDASLKDLFRGGDGDIGGERADFLHRLSFGLGDLLLGYARAAGDIFFDAPLAFSGERRSFALGLLDDLAGLGFGGARLPLIFGEQALGLLAELRACSSSPRMASARLSRLPAMARGTFR